MDLKDEFISVMQKDDHNLLCDSVDVSDTMSNIIKTAKDSKPIMDAYRNDLTAIGTADKVESFSSYGLNNNTLNWPLWLALYNDSWVFQRAINKPAQDEVNSGFTLLSSIDENGDSVDYTDVYKLFNKYKFDMIKLLQWGALFGGSIGVMMFEKVSDEEMALPLNKDKIKGSKMKIYVTDRWYGVSPSTKTVSNMKDVDYGKPESYDVTFADGKMYKVHHSYVLRYEHLTAPNLIKNGQLQGWGYAEGAHILNELSRDDQLKSSITSLVNKSLIEVIKMSGMRGVFMGADKGNEEQLRKRLEMVNWGRSYNSLTFLDKDDDYIPHQFSGLTGLSDLLEKNMWLISAALEMQGILFGDLKGGLSQESDAFKRYAVTIENRCNSYYRPVLQKLLMVLFLMLGIEETPDFVFNSLAKDELDMIKLDNASKVADFSAKLMNDGIISKYEYAKTVQNYLDHNAINVIFNEETLDMLKDNQEEELLKYYKNIRPQTNPIPSNERVIGGFEEIDENVDEGNTDIDSSEETINHEGEVLIDTNNETE